MTLPDERRRAVANTRAFLLSLLNRFETPRVPVRVRQEARRCLRHFPSPAEMARATKGAGEVFGDAQEAEHEAEIWRTGVLRGVHEA